MPLHATDLPAEHPEPAPVRMGAARVPDGPHPGFYRMHLQWPLLALAMVFGVWTVLHGDLWLADRLFAWEGNQWALQHAWITQQVIHQWGRDLSTAAWLSVLVALLMASSRRDWAPLRKPLVYLLLATALSTLLVAWIKSWSNVDCPWDIARYGGTRPYIGLLQARPEGLPRGQCFPAGHAGGGYTWVALYFFLLMVRPRLRWRGLAIGLGMGLLFGISQQLRGAHFISHDLVAAAICWTTAAVLYGTFWRKRDRAKCAVDGKPIDGTPVDRTPSGQPDVPPLVSNP